MAKEYQEIWDPKAMRKIARGEHVHPLDIRPPMRVEIQREGGTDAIEEEWDEWTGEHATKDEFDDGSSQVPEHIRKRYEEAEFDTAARIWAQRKAEADRLEPLVRTQVLAKKAAQEVRMFGHIREDTKEEMLELGLDPAELGVPTE